MKKPFCIEFLSLIAFVCILLCPLMSQAEAGSDELISKMKDTGSIDLSISRHAETGMVRFLSVDRDDAFVLDTAESPSAESSSMSFLKEYGSLFGLDDPGEELAIMDKRSVDGDRQFIRYQQTHDGIPVMGGELIVQTVGRKRGVKSVNGETVPGLNLDTTPAVDAETAAEIALELTAKTYDLDKDALATETPELTIYCPELLGLNDHRQLLVWKVIVFPLDLSLIQELVLVDAKLGIVALHFNENPTALSREVYDNQNDGTKGIPGGTPDGTTARSEGDPATSISDVDYAYDWAGETYDFYLDEHGRDSVDDAGMALLSTVRYCPDMTDCPYQNAGWNHVYNQMIYGDGYTTGLDVVAHEMTHGVTKQTSRLYYYYQSGAINEAFSDIWGEFVELTYNPGDSADKWLMGEDLPIGAIRDMQDPTVYGQPDKMSSANYWCTWYSDNGGVHTNSGVGNKAAYLMVDGDTFNSITVSPVSGGIPQVADLFYEVQTNLLTSGSDYAVLYDALLLAADNLGWSASDKQSVQDAIDAVEMDQQPTNCAATEALIAPVGDGIGILFSDDFEDETSGNWTSYAVSGSYDDWYYSQSGNPYGIDAINATSGSGNLWGLNQDDIADYAIAMTSDIAIPTLTGSNKCWVRFNHFYQFEGDASADYYDGGVFEYSTDGGSNWNDTSSLFVENGYVATLNNLYGNPLGGRDAFSASSHGYFSSRLDITTLGGNDVRFRFRIGSDTSGWQYGWYIDDFQIYLSSPLMVELADFSAQAGEEGVVLKWSTVSETDNLGFRVYASSRPDAGYVPITVGIIPARGSVHEGADYVFTDTTADTTATRYYRLEDIDAQGIVTHHHVAFIPEASGGSASRPDSDVMDAAEMFNGI